MWKLRKYLKFFLAGLTFFLLGAGLCQAANIDITSQALLSGNEVCFPATSDVGLLNLTWYQITKDAIWPGGTQTLGGYGAAVTCENTAIFNVTNAFNLGDGIYYLPTSLHTLGVPYGDLYYAVVENTGGVLSLVGSTTTLSQTRIVSTLPESNAIGSTTQSFSMTYVSAIPTPSEVCFNILEVSGFMNINPITLCDTVIANGVQTFATSTSLIDGTSYLWQSQIFVGTSTVPYEQTFIRNLLVGEPLWSPMVTEYNSTSSAVTMSPDEFCEQYADWVAPVCKMLVGLVSYSGQLTSQIFANTLGAMLSLPPFVWYTQIFTVWKSVVAESTTNTGILIVLPYGVDMTMLTTEQLNEYTGGKLDLLRSLTTMAEYAMLFAYLYHVSTRRIV